MYARDGWLDDLKDVKRITFVQYEAIQALLKIHSWKSPYDTRTKFTNRFNPAGQDDVISHFLAAIQPPLPHLRPAMLQLGFASGGDLHLIATANSDIADLYLEATRKTLMTPLEAVLICEAIFVIRSTTGYLQDLFQLL